MEKNLKQIGLALLNFQIKVDVIVKDEKNPYFKANYASLPQILDHVLPLLNSVGVVVVQIPIENNKLHTMLIHAESGECIEGIYDMHPVPDYNREWDKDKTVVVHRSSEFYDPQAIGSAITYARRYALCAMLSLNVADDDGNLASGRKTDVKQEVKKEEAKKETPKEQPKEKEKEKPAIKAPDKKEGDKTEQEKIDDFLNDKSGEKKPEAKKEKEKGDGLAKTLEYGFPGEEMPEELAKSCDILKKTKTRSDLQAAVNPQIKRLRTIKSTTESDIKFLKNFAMQHFDTLPEEEEEEA